MVQPQDHRGLVQGPQGRWQVSHLPDDDREGYVKLITAILRQALLDAQGEAFAPGTQNPAQVQAEARAWLAEETGPRDLVELCGMDATPVLQRVRQCLEHPAPAVPARQLALFDTN